MSEFLGEMRKLEVVKQFARELDSLRTYRGHIALAGLIGAKTMHGPGLHPRYKDSVPPSGLGCSACVTNPR